MGMILDHVFGQTFHGRKGQVKNAFRYHVDYVLTDLTKRHAAKTPLLFSRNGRNILSLWDSDHGGDLGEGRGAGWVFDVLTDSGLTGFDAHQVLLLAQPRVLGHVFNPVSFWLVLDGNADLRVVIAEVNNTYQGRHSYLCHHDDLRPIGPSDRLHARKIFHVSPFQEVSGDYTFRFDITDAAIGVVIDYSDGDRGVYATFHGKRRQMSDLSILHSLIARPLGSRRVLALIYWQALKLWIKGARFRAAPDLPKEPVSR